MTYNVTCKEKDSEVLQFSVDELFKWIKSEDRTVIEELKNSYRQKLPMPRDNTSTYSELYKKLAVRADDIKVTDGPTKPVVQ